MCVQAPDSLSLLNMSNVEESIKEGTFYLQEGQSSLHQQTEQHHPKVKKTYNQLILNTPILS